MRSVIHLLEKVFEGKEIAYAEEVALFDVWPHSSLDYQDCLDGITQFLYYMNKSHVDDTVLEKIKWVIKKLNRRNHSPINIDITKTPYSDRYLIIHILHRQLHPNTFYHVKY